ncbi:MAG: ABC transporter permease [Dehalococcoidales bacterium]
MTEQLSNTSKDLLIEVTPHVSELRRIIRVMASRKVVIFGAIIIIIMAIVAIFAPLLAPYDPYKVNLKESLQPLSSTHLLGTDALGRDTLSRIIYGSRTSLMIGIVSIFIASGIGMLLGLSAGYYGKIYGAVVMRFVDALMAFPMILLALVIASLLGGGISNVIIAIGISLTAVYARLMYGQVLSIKENDYVTACRAMGAGNIQIMFRHVFPNCLSPMIVLITMQLGSAILAEAGLSFLGVGIAPPGASWGSMVNDGYKYILDLPVLSFAPGIAIMLIVFAFNMVGDGLRDALDPRLRGTI